MQDPDQHRNLAEAGRHLKVAAESGCSSQPSYEAQLEMMEQLLM